MRLTYFLLVILSFLAACGNNNEEPVNTEGNEADTGISSCKADCGGGGTTDDEITEEGTDEEPEIAEAAQSAEPEADEDTDKNDNSDEVATVSDDDATADAGDEEASGGDDTANAGDDNAGQSDNSDDGAANDGDNNDSGSNDELANVEKSSAEISSYNKWQKKVLTATYDTFYLPDANWRVVCEQPCGLADELLKKKVLGAGNAIEKLIEFTGVDALAKYIPIEINVTSSGMCGDYDTLFTQYGYVNRFYSVKFPAPGSYMCLWEADDEDIILPLNDDNAKMLEAQKVLVHEYSHIIFHGRTATDPENFEDFVKAFSFYVSGHWDGDGLEPENFPKITDACDPILEIFANDVYNLCKKCGFQFDDVKTLFEMIDSAKGSGPAISESKLKEIFDTITGHDSVTECGLDWLGN